jgi:hypothetical protein
MATLWRRSGGLVVWAITAITLGALAVLSSMTAAFGVASGTSFMPCLTGTHGATVRYAVDYGPRESAITRVMIGNLSAAGCDGSPATVILRGNQAGDPSSPADETLTTLNSRVDPCSQAPLTKALVISSGTITLDACRTGGPAGYASVHDVTQVILKIRGKDTGVLGEKHHRSGHGDGVSSAGAPLTSLPFTGSWAAVTFWIGLLLVVFGTLLARAARRRRYSPGGVF